MTRGEEEDRLGPGRLHDRVRVGGDSRAAAKHPGVDSLQVNEGPVRPRDGHDRIPGASPSAVAQRLDLEIVEGVPLRETQLEDGDRLVGPSHDSAPPLKDLHGDGGATATAKQQLPRPEEVLVGVVAAPDALDRQAEDSRGNPGWPPQDRRHPPYRRATQASRT